MFKKFTDKLSRKAKSAVKSGANRAKSKAKSAVRDAAEDAVENFVKNAKKVDKTIKGKVIWDFDTFKSEWEKVASDPVQSVLFFINAAYVYLKDRKTGDAMVTILIPTPYLNKDPSSPSGFRLNPKGDGYLLMHMAEDGNIVKSYMGGTDKNNYEIDEDEFEMHVVGLGVDERSATVIIQSGGKHFNSPVNLKRNNDDQWKLFNISNIATGVRETEDEKYDF
ncbi:hypothetical protein GF325_14025 [Candidatus Bathyarchaeota archaeon]|nr:hypothetical protein [Candidatus Bathyarchaeota archaeon]